MNRGGFGTDRLVHDGVCGEVRRRQRRHFIGGRGSHRGRRARRRRIPGDHYSADALQISSRGRQRRRQCGYELHVLLLMKQAHLEAGRDCGGRRALIPIVHLYEQTTY